VVALDCGNADIIIAVDMKNKQVLGNDLDYKSTTKEDVNRNWIYVSYTGLIIGK